jgi:hypothetical protein
MLSLNKINFRHVIIKNQYDPTKLQKSGQQKKWKQIRAYGQTKRPPISEP